MEHFRHINNVTTLQLNREACVGCGQCTRVCPHTVFVLENKKATIIDRDGCMECGACRLNCPTAAITVTPGVGCAACIIDAWRKKYFPQLKSKAGCCG